jgi:hypothetical protein
VPRGLESRIAEALERLRARPADSGPTDSGLNNSGLNNSGK